MHTLSLVPGTCCGFQLAGLDQLSLPPMPVQVILLVSWQAVGPDPVIVPVATPVLMVASDGLYKAICRVREGAVRLWLTIGTEIVPVVCPGLMVRVPEEAV